MANKLISYCFYLTLSKQLFGGGGLKEVSAAIIVEGDCVLLARRAPGQKLEGLWEFPGGKREVDETIEDCLIRELKEELALSVETAEVFGVSQYHYPGGAIRLVGIRARIIEGSPMLSVHDKVEWVSVSNILDYELAPADVPLAQRLKENHD